MSLVITTVDAFTNRMFSGNPAAVTVLPEPRPAEWMQQLALEMNLAETSFLQRLEDGSYNLRWFTPAMEVDLCGHATLAAAHVLWQTGALPEHETARFHTRSGLLTATRQQGWIQLDFPATPVTEVEPPAGLLESVALTPAFIGKSKFDYLLEISEPELKALTPDFNTMAKLACRGVIVTSRSSNPEYHFLSRFFAPAAGINEDPVTGSSHCALTPFWSQKLGRTKMQAHQASKRGGDIRVELQGDRVQLAGQAITVLTATMFDLPVRTASAVNP